MIDETKKLFNAPWYPDRAEWELAFVVKNEEGKEIAKSSSPDDIKRIARLPELYEELKSSSYDFCWSCLATLGIDPPTADELVENLCPRKPSCCGYNNRWKLLKKVRDGE